MMQRAFACVALVAAAVTSAPLARAAQAHCFYVLNQRTVALAAAAHQEDGGGRRQQLRYGPLCAPRRIRVPRAVDLGGLWRPCHHGEPAYVPAEGKRRQEGPGRDGQGS